MIDIAHEILGPLVQEEAASRGVPTPSFTGTAEVWRGEFWRVEVELDNIEVRWWGPGTPEGQIMEANFHPGARAQARVCLTLLAVHTRAVKAASGPDTPL